MSTEDQAATMPDSYAAHAHELPAPGSRPMDGAAAFVASLMYHLEAPDVRDENLNLREAVRELGEQNGALKQYAEACQAKMQRQGAHVAELRKYHEAVLRKFEQLKEAYSQQSTELAHLREQEAGAEQIKEEHAQQRADMIVLRQQYDAVAKAAEQLKQEHSQQSAELIRLREHEAAAAQLKQEHAQQTTDMAVVRQQYEAATKSVEQLKQEHSRTLRDLAEEHRAIRTEHDELKKKLSVDTALGEKVQRLRSVLSDKEQELQQASQRLESVMTKHADIVVAAANLRGQLQTAQAESRVHAAKIATLEQERDALKTAVESLRALSSAAEEKDRKRAQEIQALTADRDACKADAAERARDAAKWTAEREALTGERDRWMAEAHVLSEKAATALAARDEVTMLEAEVSALTTKLDAGHKNAERQADRTAALTRDCEARVAEIAQLKTGAEKSCEERDAALAEIKRLNDELVTARGDSKALSAACQELDRVKAEHERKTRELRQKMEHHRIEEVKAADRCAELHNALRDLRNQVEHHRAAETKAIDRCTELHDALDRLRNQLKDSDHVVNALRHEKEQTENAHRMRALQYDRLETRLRAAQREKEDEAKARREADKEVQKNTHELGCMKDENTRLLAQVDELRRAELALRLAAEQGGPSAQDRVDQLTAANDEHVERISKLEECLRMEKTSHDSLSRAMLGKRDDLVAEIARKDAIIEQQRVQLATNSTRSTDPRRR